LIELPKGTSGESLWLMIPLVRSGVTVVFSGGGTSSPTPQPSSAGSSSARTTGR